MMKRMSVLLVLVSIVLMYQNCSPGFKTSELASIGPAPSGTDEPTPLPPITCTLAEGSQLPLGATVDGFATSSASFPTLCGVKATRTCLSSGNFDGPMPVFDTCAQLCLHPTTNQPVAAGSDFVYFTRASGATQAECDAARVTASCQQTTGLFSPAIPAQRFATCLVQGQTCAYTVSAGTATPSGNMTGATVTGFALATATFPTLCGANVTRTCQSTGQWSGAVPVYTACAQRCVHPDNNQPVDAGSAYAYYTRSTGTTAECTAARVTSSCQQATGVFSPAVAATRFATCQIQDVPARVTHEMLIGNDMRYNVFKQSCVGCHSAASAQGGLNLESATMSKAKATAILSSMKNANNPMPPSGVLQDGFKIAVVEKWVSLGAPSDTPAPTPTPTPTPAPTPVPTPTPPAVGDYAPDNGPVVGATNKIVTVSTAAQLMSALAAANPADVIQLNAGTYKLSDSKIRVSRAGTAAAPIFLRSTTLGPATIELCNVEGFYVSAPNWVFENLVIRGGCADGTNNEHAFHLVGGSTNTVIRNSKIVNFMSHVKVNCDVSGTVFTCPSGIKFIGSRWFNDKAIPGNAPFNVLNIDGANNVVVRGNLFYDFASANSAKSATAIYPKMHSNNVLVEQNFVVCEKNLVTGSNRRALNVGDALDGNPNCINSNCKSFNGLFRNNIFMNCQGSGNSFGIGVINQDTSNFLHNTTLNVKHNWYDTTAPKGNLFKANLFSQGWASQTAGHLPTLEQNVTLTKVDGSDAFLDPQKADFNIVSAGVPNNLSVNADSRSDYDFCGYKRSTATTVGAIDYKNAKVAECLKRINDAYLLMKLD